MNILKTSKGFSLVELLVAISFISISIVLVFTLITFNSKLRRLNEEKTQALLYATEAIEAVQLISWEDLVIGDYYPSVQDNKWTLVAGSETIDKFTRTITISNVYRANSTNDNVYGSIVETGYLDPNTKRVTVIIDWLSASGFANQEELETYMYRWKAERWTQTDWSGDSGQNIWSDENKFFYRDSGVDVREVGTVSLQSGFIDWSYATTTDIFDTPGNFDDNDVDELDGIAYLVTKNNPAGPELYVLDVSDVYNITQISTLDLGDSVSTVVAQGDYLYLATANNAAEFQIVDISNSYAPVVVGIYDLPSNDDATDISVNQNQAYISQGNDIYSLDITDPTAPQLLDNISVGDIISKIFVLEDYVYMATKDDLKELQIIDVTNPINMQIITEYDLPGSLKGSDIYVRGIRLYISTDNNGGGPEFFVFDVSDLFNPVDIGSFELGETIYSFSIIGPYALLGNNFLDKELVIVDVSVPGVMTQVAEFDLEGHVLGMSANCSIIHAATSINIGEFFIISTEVTNCEYTSAGILESSTYDTGSDQVSYNWISWTGTTPANTTIRFQLATSANIDGPWNYLGPDGTNSSYYTMGAQELINYNAHLDQRYIRYKLYLNSYNDLAVPILDEVTISYSTYP